MKKILIMSIMMLFAHEVAAQNANTDSIKFKYFTGSTLFMLANLIQDSEPPRYYQLNFGYRLNHKSTLSFEMITWNYYEPIGVPFSQKETAINFQGRVQAFGAGIAYKRFLWKRAYLQIHSTAMHQNYLDLSGSKIQSGFQLFNTFRIGYQFRFFNDRFFIEPSIACTFWPINTNLPESFQLEENKYPNYFIGEPGLHFGINF